MPTSSIPTLPRRHPAALIAAHWLSAACIVIAALAALLRELIDNEAARALLLGVHRQAGLSVIVLVAIRLAARLTRHNDAEPTSLPALMRWMAAASHALLYAALIGLPLLGWALSDARGQHPHLFGLLPLPTLAPTDPDLAETLEDWHRRVAWGLGATVVMHIGAALWHHWVRRDDVLRAMWPAPVRASLSASTRGTT